MDNIYKNTTIGLAIVLIIVVSVGLTVFCIMRRKIRRLLASQENSKQSEIGPIFEKCDDNAQTYVLNLAHEEGKESSSTDDDEHELCYTLKVDDGCKEIQNLNLILAKEQHSHKKIKEIPVTINASIEKPLCTVEERKEFIKEAECTVEHGQQIQDSSDNFFKIHEDFKEAECTVEHGQQIQDSSQQIIDLFDKVKKRNANLKIQPCRSENVQRLIRDMVFDFTEVGKKIKKPECTAEHGQKQSQDLDYNLFKILENIEKIKQVIKENEALVYSLNTIINDACDFVKCCKADAITKSFVDPCSIVNIATMEKNALLTE